MDKDILDGEIERLNRDILKVSETAYRHGQTKKVAVYSLALVVFSAVVFFGVYLGASITGLVTFSEFVVSSEQVHFVVNASGTLQLIPGIDQVDALMLSGSVSGAGRVAVFLVLPEGRKLVYFFEGDAGSGRVFSDVCFESCYLSGVPDELILSVELDGVQLVIDGVTYLHSRLIDMVLEPEEVVIDYNKEKARVIDLVLKNSRKENFSVVLMLDGPLAQYFTWQGSVIRMSADDSEKVVPVAVKLPSGLPKGEYVHKVTARYVPPDAYEFSGAAPVAEVFVTVLNK